MRMPQSYPSYQRRVNCIRHIQFEMWLALLGSGAYSTKRARMIQAKGERLVEYARRLFVQSRMKRKASQ